MVRLVSGVALAAAVLAAVLLLPVWALRVVACAVAALAGREYLEIAGVRLRAVVLVVALCWVAAGPELPPAYVLLSMALLWVAVEVLFAGDAVQRATAGLFAAVYVGLPLGLLVAVHAAQGWPATLLLVAAIVVSDSSQYYTGRLLGRRPLAPAISPNKTVEGALGGLVCGTAFMVVAGARALPAAGPGARAGHGVLVVGKGISGDRLESRRKRAPGGKDPSPQITRHGGGLDRIDALLFAVVPFYLFVRNIP
jgi:phosphatidate cytidylyltransferase